jgi:hypothetical protein
MSKNYGLITWKTQDQKDALFQSLNIAKYQREMEIEAVNYASQQTSTDDEQFVDDHIVCVSKDRDMVVLAVIVTRVSSTLAWWSSECRVIAMCDSNEAVDAFVEETRRVRQDHDHSALLARCQHIENLLREALEAGYLDARQVPNPWLKAAMAATRR